MVLGTRASTRNDLPDTRGGSSASASASVEGGDKTRGGCTVAKGASRDYAPPSETPAGRMRGCGWAESLAKGCLFTALT